jgi:hypothetical protein
MKFPRLTLISLVWLGAISAASAQSYDATAQVSFTQNPNGVWTYGWSTNLAGPITVFTGTYVSTGNEQWTDDSILFAGDPNIGYTPANDVTELSPLGGNPLYCLGISPGPGNQFTHCEFTAPTTGTYNVQATFTATSYGVPHAYVLNNGNILGDGYLNNAIPWSSTYYSVPMAAGDTVDAVMGVGADGNFVDDEEFFSFTVTKVTQTTPLFVPGAYYGTLSGTDNFGPAGTGGALTAEIGASGVFTAKLNIGGSKAPFKGTISATSPYSGVVQLPNGTAETVNLAFDNVGNLTGTVSDINGTLSLLVGKERHSNAHEGLYLFTFAAIPTSGPGNLPTATGGGLMDVLPGGGVVIAGRLGDGASFSTASAITSGSYAQVYAPVYKTPGGGISTTLLFRNVPKVCAAFGDVCWVRPADNSSSPYSGGFGGRGEFLASNLDLFIAGLTGAGGVFDPGGSDLVADVGANVGLQFNQMLFSGPSGRAVTKVF